jgi:hypothetical protein
VKRRRWSRRDQDVAQDPPPISVISASSTMPIASKSLRIAMRAPDVAKTKIPTNSNMTRTPSPKGSTYHLTHGEITSRERNRDRPLENIKSLGQQLIADHQRRQ